MGSFFETKHRFTHPLNTVLFVSSVLKKLGCGKLESLPDRIKNQKVQYFAQLFNVTPSYDYNLYIRGPYSPDLTKDIYSLVDEKIEVPDYDFSSEEIKNNFVKLEQFIKGKTVRELELIATLHWLINVVGFSLENAKIKLKELKDTKDEEIVKSTKSVEILWKNLN